MDSDDLPTIDLPIIPPQPEIAVDGSFKSWHKTINFMQKVSRFHRPQCSASHYFVDAERLKGKVVSSVPTGPHHYTPVGSAQCPKIKPIHCTVDGYLVCNNDIAKPCWHTLHLECWPGGLGNGRANVCQPAQVKVVSLHSGGKALCISSTLVGSCD